MKSFRARYPCIMTAASLRSRSPALTLAITFLISSLMVRTSVEGRLLPALEADRRRSSACLGECAQQYPSGPLAGSVQSVPSLLVPRHLLANGLTPFYEVVRRTMARALTLWGGLLLPRSAASRWSWLCRPRLRLRFYDRRAVWIGPRPNEHPSAIPIDRGQGRATV